MKTPSYNKPTALSEGKIKLIGVSPEFGLGYRRWNMIFRAGPISVHTDSTSKDKYNDSDSLFLSDEYYLSHYSIEFSYSWYYHKPSMRPISFQIEPFVGYERFLRGYYGEIQDLRIKQKPIIYDNRVVSSGRALGGHVTFIYPRNKKTQTNVFDKANYETDRGPYVSLSYRNFSNIQYLTLETGLIEINFERKTIIERSTIFFRIEAFNGAMKGRTHRIGFSLAGPFKAFFREE
jgi:hypothetical protein